MELFPGLFYCIDTCSLIELRRRYPRSVFPTLWGNIESLIHQGRLIAPREVLHELEEQDDELLDWTKRHRIMFKDLDQRQLQLVRDILRNFPSLVDPNKMTPDADPFVIALAISERCTVITEERQANPWERPKIPNVCENHNVRCIRLIELFEREGWRF